MPAKRLTHALLLLAALRATSTFASEWDGSQSDFFNPSSWSPPIVPGPSDTALFDQGGIVSFSNDASTLNAIVTGSPLTLSITASLGLPPGPLPPQPHTYTLTGTAADTLSVSSALAISDGTLSLANGGGVRVSGGALSVTNGTLSLPNSGMLLDNANVTLGPTAVVTAGGLSQINNGSTLNITGDSTFTAGSMAVGNTGSGSLIVGPKETHDPVMIVTHDLSLAPEPGSVAHALVQSAHMTVGGTLYVGGSAAGPGGTADLTLKVGYTDSMLTADHLVLYAGSTILTNQCTIIYTQVSDIAGSLKFNELASIVQATSAINLLPGSRTTLVGGTQIISPTITLSSGAILSGASTSTGGTASLLGNVINAGEIDAADLRIQGIFMPSFPGSYTQLSSGLLAGTAGNTSLLIVSGSGSTASLAGTLRLSFDDPAAVHAGDSFAIISAPLITGSFSSIDLVGLDGFSASFSDATGRLTLISSKDSGNGPVPEPASLALLALATLALSARLHRRHF